jgi:nucleoid DNA-binding protein
VPQVKTAPKGVKISPATKARSSSEFYNAIAGQTTLTRKQVASVFEAFSDILAADLGKKGPGVLKVPGLMKVTVKRKPAEKAMKRINPFTKQEYMSKPKPARNVVKVRPMKGLKDAV